MQNLQNGVHLAFQHPAFSDKEIPTRVEGETVEGVEEVFLQMHLPGPFR